MFSIRKLTRTLRAISLNLPARALHHPSTSIAHSDHSDVQLSWDGGRLTVHTGQKDWRLNSRWLRYDCRCASCFQRSARSLNWLKGLESAWESPSVVRAGLTSEGAIQVDWSDGHQSVHHMEQILSRHEDEIAKIADRSPLTWDSVSLESCQVERQNFHEFLQERSVQRQLFDNIYRFGFSFIDGAPVNASSLNEILDTLGGKMPTIYTKNEDQTGTIAPDDKHFDLGWSPLPVPPHTDLSYMDNVPAVVGLHLLKHEGGTGGDFAFIDGFNVCRQMSINCPHLLSSLSTYPVIFRYTANEGEEIFVDTVVRRDILTGAPIQLRWNAMYITPAHPGPGQQQKLDEFYKAFDFFYRAVHLEPRNRLEFKPKVGTILVLDNWRMLHERSTGFTGDRVMQTGAVSRDSLMHKARKLEVLPS